MAALLAALPGNLLSQCPTPGSLARLVQPYRVKWNVGNLLVTPDSTQGVSFWFATNVRARMDGHELQRQFDERFEPDSLVEWMIYTRQLLDLKAPLPNDTSGVVKSGVLRGLGGGIVIAARLRHGKKLSDKVRILMSPKSDSAVLVELDRKSVDSLLNVSETAAQRSLYRPVMRPADARPDPFIVPVGPSQSKLHPEYPGDLQRRGIEGEVWARFCVDTDGRPDLSTFQAQLSDHDEFEDAVRDYLEQVRYTPAMQNGAPIRQLVAQRFVFGLR